MNIASAIIQGSLTLMMLAAAPVSAVRRNAIGRRAASVFHAMRKPSFGNTPFTMDAKWHANARGSAANRQADAQPALTFSVRLSGL
jgi:hypothetical protein